MDKKNEGADKSVLQQPPFKGLTDSIKQFPADALLYLQRGQLLSQKGLYELALNDYKKAYDLEPGEETALQYASGLFLSQKIADAVKFLETAAKKYPNNTEFNRRLGEAYLQNGQTHLAMKQYDDIIATDSFAFEAWYEKGSILAKMKDTAGAIKALEKSYSIQPLVLSGLALANLYAETKNTRTLALCDELISRDSAAETADPIFLKGVYYANTGNSAKALEQFDACIQTDWKFADAYIEKGIIFFEQKNIDEALRTFKLASTVNNTYADAYYWQGRCYEVLKQNNDAIDNYVKALALDRDFEEAQKGIDRLSK
jgi:tetratricopeptide (TPR) repeat protein